MLHIRDTTLREGLQTNCLKWNDKQALAVFVALQNLGIRTFEIGLSHTSSCYKTYVESILREARLDTRIALYIDPHPEGVNFLNTYPKELGASFTLKTSPTPRGREVASVHLDEGLHAIEKIVAQGRTLRVGIEHAFSLTPEYLTTIITKLSPFPLVISLSDSSGSLFPSLLIERVKSLSILLRGLTSIGFHFHNDKGLAAGLFATIYELQDLLPSKIIVDATLGGIGERNGITSIGDIIAILVAHDPTTTKNIFDLRHYAAALDALDSLGFASVWSRDPLSKNSFIHVAESHCAALANGDDEYQKIPSTALGYEPLKAR